MPGTRINGKYFNNSYDATKYLLRLVSKRETVTIQPNERPALGDVVRPD